MKLKNISARPHHVGDVYIAPGEAKEIQKEFEGTFNAEELIEYSGDFEQKVSKKQKKQSESVVD